MVLAEREWLRAIGLTGGAVLLFTVYCQLHGWMGTSAVDPSASIRWGVIAGVPSGLSVWLLWSCRARLARMVTRGWTGTSALGAGLFAVLLLGGSILHQLAIGGPLIEELPRRVFNLLPVSLALAGLAVAAVRLWQPRPPAGPVPFFEPLGHSPTQPNPMPWIAFPEEPRLRLRACEVRMVRSAANYCEFYAGERVHLVRLPIKRAEERLNEHGFVRVHRTALVNRAHIRAVGPFGPRRRLAVQLECGTSVPIGRAYQHAVGHGLAAH